MAATKGTGQVSTGLAKAADRELRALSDANRRGFKPVAVADQIPYTIKMLQSLAPGEKMVYYRGNMTIDSMDAGPAYRKLLAEIKEFAEHLEHRGRVRLYQETERVPGMNGNIIAINRYMAQGI